MAGTAKGAMVHPVAGDKHEEPETKDDDCTADDFGVSLSRKSSLGSPRPGAIVLAPSRWFGRVRCLCRRVVNGKWFSCGITFVVLLNTITLGLVDYSDPWADGPNPTLTRNKLVDHMNNLSLGIFFAEALLKIVGYGFLRGPTAYCKDNWNLLDLVVLISGALSWLVHSGSFGQLRILRVLRPLRTLHSFPGLKVLVNGVLSSLPALIDVGILLGFSYLVFAILGMEIWAGAYHNRCRLTEFPVVLNFDPLHAPSADVYPNQTYVELVVANPSAYRCPRIDVDNANWTTPQPCFWPIDPNDDQYCGSRSCAVGRTCGSNYDGAGHARFQDIVVNGSVVVPMATEGDFTASLNFGLTNFDTVGYTMIIIFQIVTASGWMALSQNTQDAYSWIVSGIYFNAVLFVGMCFLLQLNMAVMFNEYEKAKTAQQKTPPQLLFRSRVQRQYKLCPAQPATTWKSPLERWAKAIAMNRWYRRLGFTMTLLNVVLLACDHHPRTAEFAYNAEVASFAFLIYFALEMAVKILALGFRAYCRDKFNQYDCLTIVIGGLETVLDPPMFMDGTPGVQSPFSVMRAARAIQLARSWKSVDRLLLAIVGALREILNFLFFLVLFIYIYALMGMELFATKYQFDAHNNPAPFNSTDPTVSVHRANFDTIQWAFFTVFQVLTYDDWPAVMYDGWLSVGLVAPVYFLSIVVLGVWVVMNMFTAIMVQSVMDDASVIASSTVPSDEAAPTLAMVTRLRLRHLRRVLRRLLGVHRVVSVEEPVLGTKSFGCFTLHSPLRQHCLWLVQHRCWHALVTASIGVSCVCTALDTPLLDPQRGLGWGVGATNNALAVLFTAEMLVTMVALGLCACLADPWRVLDLFIVFVSLMSWSASGAWAPLRALRSLRALRPLRVIHRMPQLQVVVNTLFRCFPDIGRSLLFFVFVLVLFGIACVMFFKGAFSSCSVSPYNYLNQPAYAPQPPWFPAGYSGSYSMADLELYDVMTFPRAWTNMTPASQRAADWLGGCGFAPTFVPTSRAVCECFSSLSWSPVVPQGFDNIAAAVGSLYELTTMEGWSFVAIAAVDATGPDMQPLPNFAEGWMVFWFAFMVTCAFFVTNLFIGVLCDSFMRENYGVMVTDEQLDWVKLQRKVLAMAPVVRYPPPSDSTWRLWCYDLVHRPAFETAVTSCILLNLIVLSAGYFGAPAWYKTACSTVTNGLAVAFAVEMALKMAAFGPRYFHSSCHRFDAAVVVLALGAMALPDAAGMGPLATVVRVFRVGRILRLFHKATLLKSLYDTIAVSLPALGNVTALLMLLYYIFAAVGVQLFAKVGYGPSMVNSHQNFQSFWLALQTLIGFSTGENWDNYLWELYAISPPSNPTCADPVFDSSMCGFNDAPGCVPLNGCGSWYIVPFMYLFELVVGYIGLNLFSGIVVDAIGDSCAKSAITPSNLAEFTTIWSEYDPEGLGLISIDDLCRCLARLTPPFGFRGVEGLTMRRMYRVIGGLDIPIYDGHLVHFKDVPRALVQRSLSDGDEAKFTEIGELMERLGVNKQFDDAWLRGHSKSHAKALYARAQTPIREFVALIVMTKFLYRVRYRNERRRRLHRQVLAGHVQWRWRQKGSVGLWLRMGLCTSAPAKPTAAPVSAPQTPVLDEPPSALPPQRVAPPTAEIAEMAEAAEAPVSDTFAPAPHRSLIPERRMSFRPDFKSVGVRRFSHSGRNNSTSAMPSRKISANSMIKTLLTKSPRETPASETTEATTDILLTSVRIAQAFFGYITYRSEENPREYKMIELGVKFWMAVRDLEKIGAGAFKILTVVGIYKTFLQPNAKLELVIVSLVERQQIQTKLDDDQIDDTIEMLVQMADDVRESVQPVFKAFMTDRTAHGYHLACLATSMLPNMQPFMNEKKERLEEILDQSYSRRSLRDYFNRVGESPEFLFIVDVLEYRDSTEALIHDSLSDEKKALHRGFVMHAVHKIYNKYLKAGSKSMIRISTTNRELILAEVSSMNPPKADVFDAALRECSFLLITEHLEPFLSSIEYASMKAHRASLLAGGLLHFQHSPESHKSILSGKQTTTPAALTDIDRLQVQQVIKGTGAQYFRAHLQQFKMEHTLDFYLEIEQFQLLPHNKRNYIAAKASKIFNKYIRRGAKMEVALPGHIRQAILASIADPAEDIFNDAHLHVLYLWESKYFRAFERSPKYQELVQQHKLEREADNAYGLHRVGHNPRCLVSRNVERSEHALAAAPKTLQILTITDAKTLLLQDGPLLTQFHKFLVKENCTSYLLFYMQVEEYKRLPKSDFLVRQSKKIYHRFLNCTAKEFVSVSEEAMNEVHEMLQAPSPQTFHLAQEEVLYFLYKTLYPKFQKSAFYTDGATKAPSPSRRPSPPKPVDVPLKTGTRSRKFIPTSMQRQFASRVSTSGAQYPPTIDDLLTNVQTRALFLAFCEEIFCAESMYFWLECLEYQRIPHTDYLRLRAQKIFRKYISPNAKLQVNLIHSIVRDIERQIDNPGRQLFVKAQQAIVSMLNKDTLPKFVRSKYYEPCCKIIADSH
ncbi:Voltage-gated Ion Channel (VIC) Superfamily [Achlya hypogyna]|uniref:Voltage-gated Ion Channel (VIC) Superfamily n=1 Tax=Achlya hypogyna TaxID=1202772 RepID=A0A1V9ZG59_ACHHY|nr:Voltage-gated Ion Channel (VIC) Superfamily [Achlya hypogyna]